MAAEELEEVGGGEPSGGKGKIIILASVGLILVVVAVVGTLYFLGTFGGEGDAEEEQTAEGQEGAPPPDLKGPAVYFPIQPSLVVAYNSRGRQRFLQVDITLMSRDPAALEAVQLHTPVIRNNLTLLYGAQDYDNLRQKEGREFVRQKTIEEIQTILQKEIGRPGIENAFFTNYVMQ